MRQNDPAWAAAHARRTEAPKRPPVRLFRDFKHLARLFYSGTVFVAFDTETTGLRAESDFVMEVGAVKFTCSGEISRYGQLIRPPVPIMPFLTNLTHITNEMVAGCPSAAQALPDFLRYIDGKKTVLLAHNAPFDVGFINAELARMQLPPLANTVIDTLPLARWAYPKLILEPEKGQYKLQALARRFGIEVRAAHRADDDARVLVEVFKHILSDTMSVQKDYSIHSAACELGAPQPELF